MIAALWLMNSEHLMIPEVIGLQGFAFLLEHDRRFSPEFTRRFQKNQRFLAKIPKIPGLVRARNLQESSCGTRAWRPWGHTAGLPDFWGNASVADSNW
jgi:hypothetical protein